MTYDVDRRRNREDHNIYCNTKRTVFCWSSSLTYLSALIDYYDDVMDSVDTSVFNTCGRTVGHVQ